MSSAKVFILMFFSLCEDCVWTLKYEVTADVCISEKVEIVKSFSLLENACSDSIPSLAPKAKLRSRNSLPVSEAVPQLADQLLLCPVAGGDHQQAILAQHPGNIPYISLLVHHCLFPKTDGIECSLVHYYVVCFLHGFTLSSI